MVESPLNKSSSCGDIFLRREKLAWEALKTIFDIKKVFSIFMW
jgi:hypothetical protein